MTDHRSLVAVITGAGSGLGRRLALDLAAQGCALALGDRDSEGLEETRRLVSEAHPGSRLALGVLDVTQPEQCAQLIQGALGAFGRIDYLVLCAGISMWARFDEIEDLSLFERLIAVNYLGAVYCVHAALPALRESRGWIVAISSLQAEVALPNHSGYGAAKHALNGFLDGLECELEGEIRFLTVMPGWIRGTNLRANALGPDPADKQTPRKHSGESVSVEECSRLILKALERGKRKLYIPSKLGALPWLKLVAPGVVRRLIGRAVKQQK